MKLVWEGEAPWHSLSGARRLPRFDGVRTAARGAALTIDPSDDVQGWYSEKLTSEQVRVRLSADSRSLYLHTLSDRLVAAWPLDHLENREIPIVGANWSVGDRRLPEASLLLENDEDYSDLRRVSPRLKSTRARLRRQLSFSALHSGNRPGNPGFIWTGSTILMVVIVLGWHWLFG